MAVGTQLKHAASAAEQQETPFLHAVMASGFLHIVVIPDQQALLFRCSYVDNSVHVSRDGHCVCKTESWLEHIAPPPLPSAHVNWTAATTSLLIISLTDNQPHRSKSVEKSSVRKRTSSASETKQC